MTCIVGLAHEGKVYMGGDSAGVGGWDLTIRADEKVFVNGPFLMGFTTSFRMGQLLRHAFTPPDHDPRTDTDKFMVTTFVDAVRSCLKAGGFATKKEDQETGGDFLVGYRGTLYRICGDYQVSRSAKPYDAVGCGREFALGSLFAADPGEPPGPDGCVKLALMAAEQFSAGVRGPFKLLSL